MQQYFSNNTQSLIKLSMYQRRHRTTTTTSENNAQTAQTAPHDAHRETPDERGVERTTWETGAEHEHRVILPDRAPRPSPPRRAALQLCL